MPTGADNPRHPTMTIMVTVCWRAFAIVPPCLESDAGAASISSTNAANLLPRMKLQRLCGLKTHEPRRSEVMGEQSVLPRAKGLDFSHVRLLDSLSSSHGQAVCGYWEPPLPLK